MNITDYLIDSVLVLLVLIQIKERKLSNRPLIRPLIILGIAVVNYLHGIPAHGNDLVLTAVFCVTGALIGIASGVSVIMHRHEDGTVTFRSGWISGFFWVLGMGSRFAFIYWITHTGAGSIAHFSANHSITSSEAWTVALLGMAVFEVISRTAIMFLRWKQLEGKTAFALAA